MIFNLLFFLGVALGCSIPLDKIFLWITSLYRKTFRDAKPPKQFYVSKAPFIFIIANGLELLKGYSLFFVANFFYDDDLILLATFLIGTFFQTYSFFGKRSFFSTLAFVLGLFSSLWLPSILLYPLLFCIFIVFFNNLYSGLQISIILFSFVVWLIFQDAFYIYVGITMGMAILFSYLTQFIRIFSGRPQSLKVLFDGR